MFLSLTSSAQSHMRDHTVLPFYFDLSFPVFFQFSFLMHLEQHTELDNLITMRGSTCAPPRRGFTASTPSLVMIPRTCLQRARQLPGFLLLHHPVFSQTTLRSASCSPKHTENTPITAVRTAVSVSQSSLSVCSIDNTVGERNVDQSIGFGVTRNTYSAHSKFSENTQAEKVVDRTGKPVGENSSNDRLGPCLMNRDRLLSQSIARKFVITNSKQPSQTSQDSTGLVYVVRGVICTFSGIMWTLCRMWAFLALLALDVARTLLGVMSLNSRIRLWRLLRWTAWKP